MVSPESAWNEIDREIVEHKLSLIANEMQPKVLSEERRVVFESQKTGNRGARMPSLVTMHVGLTNEWLERIYQAYCEVWAIQRKVKSAGFVRAVFQKALVPHIAMRQGSICSRLDAMARGSGSASPAKAELVRALKRLQGKWRDKLEIEAEACKYHDSRSVIQAGQPQPSGELQSTVGNPSLDEEPKTAGSDAHYVSPEEIATAKRDPLFWRSMHAEFKALADEELTLARGSGNGRDKRLVAYVSCEKQIADSEKYYVYCGYSEEFKARFEAVATRAGIALNPIKRSDALGLWLHRLFQHLQKHNSNFLFGSYREDKGIVKTVCTASATYCARLERATSELEVTVEARKRKRTPRPKPPCFYTAKRLLAMTPKPSLVEFCRLMDSKAAQYSNNSKYLPPKSWGVNSFHEQYKKRGNTVSRFLSQVRKDMASPSGTADS